MVTTLQKAFGQYLHTLFLGHIYTCYSITITRSFLKSFLKEHNNIDLNFARVDIIVSGFGPSWGVGVKGK